MVTSDSRGPVISKNVYWTFTVKNKEKVSLDWCIKKNFSKKYLRFFYPYLNGRTAYYPVLHAAFRYFKALQILPRADRDPNVPLLVVVHHAVVDGHHLEQFNDTN